MWKVFFRPDVMFGLALVQGLLPYVLWWSGLDKAPESSSFTYLPVLIWFIAYAAFLLGTATAKARHVATQYSIAPFSRSVTVFVWTMAILLIVQLIAVTAVYGTLPILSFLRHDGLLNIDDVNTMQEASGFGQIGLLITSNVVFNGALLLRLLCHLDAKRRLSLSTAGFLLLSVLSALYDGKRQGLMITVVYLACGLSLYCGSPALAVSRLLRLPRGTRLVTPVLFILTLLGLVGVVGFVSGARNQGARGRSGTAELIAYLEYPLLNLERQTQDSGLGPYSFDVFYPVLTLVPFKFQHSLGQSLIPAPPKLVPSSPSSFFERLQWGWGPIGIALFCFAAGAITMRLYYRIRVNVGALLIYCLCAYALFSAYAYNHFLNLVFLPIPAVIFAVCANGLWSASPGPVFRIPCVGRTAQGRRRHLSRAAFSQVEPG